MLLIPHVRIFACGRVRASGEQWGVGNNISFVTYGLRCDLVQALMEAAEKQNGNVVCPRTGAVFKYSDAKKIFIM